VDTWGNDFRPSYSQLAVFKDHDIQMVAFTGTATEVTKQHIVESLQLKSPHTVRVSLERPNLLFTVAEKKN
jgi:ATP-dependent DNA helicase RecQ